MNAATRVRGPVSTRLAAHPLIREIGNGAAEILIAPDFVLPAGREALIGAIMRGLRPSTIANPNGDAAFRTSKTCDLDSANEVVRSVRGSMAALLGLALENGEPMQGQHYGVGGEFKLHTDYFEPGSDGWRRYCEEPGHGQRTWTGMIYLNDVPEGGHTLFPFADVDMRPEAGTLLLWNNLLPDGAPNPATRHHATPVVRGDKTVLTQWFREKPWR